VPAPHPTDGWEFVVPFFTERLELRFGIIDGGGPVNALQIGDHYFTILPGNKVQAVAHHVHNAQLDFGLQINALNRIREAGQAIDAGNQDGSATHRPSSSFSSAILSLRAR